MAEWMIRDDLKATGKCRLFIAKEDFYPNLCAFATTKSNPLAKILGDEYVHILLILYRINN